MIIEFSSLILLVITFLYLGISTIYKYIKNISTNYKSEILNLFLFLSILFIISLTLFPIRLGYKFEGFKVLNIVPFKIILKMIFEYPLEQFIYNVIGNIVLFIPFGFFIYIKFEKNKTKTLLAVLIMTLGIEFIQGFIPYRFCDIDDIILNTFGGLIGIITYNVFTYILDNILKKYRLLSNLYFFLKYIQLDN